MFLLSYRNTSEHLGEQEMLNAFLIMIFILLIIIMILTLNLILITIIIVTIIVIPLWHSPLMLIKIISCHWFQVGYAMTTYHAETEEPVIGFDMGGM